MNGNIKTPEQVNEACAFLANHVQSLLVETRGDAYKGIQPAGSFILPESDEETISMLEARGIPYQREGGVYPISEPTGEYLGTLIHIPQTKRDILASSSDASRLMGNDMPAYATLIEEVSHFTYIDWYYKTHGELPNSAMVEFVGAMDKYNVFQKEFVNKYGRFMNEDEVDKVLQEVASAYTPDLVGVTPGIYVIGHRLAFSFIEYLNNLRGSGQADFALSELGKVMEMKSGPQYRYLVRVCGLQYETFSDNEEENIKSIIQELESKDLRRWK